MSITCHEEYQVCRYRVLRRGSLWGHVSNDELEDSLQFVGLKDKHLVTYAAIPDELFLVDFEVGGRLPKSAMSPWHAPQSHSPPAVRQSPKWTSRPRGLWHSPASTSAVSSHFRPFLLRTDPGKSPSCKSH